jgi:hypothetical protein
MRELSSLDYDALELLAASRAAVEQEINGRAQALHEAALEEDKTLSLIGFVGQEALGLYGDFVKRDAYFRGSDYVKKYSTFNSIIDDDYPIYSRPFRRRAKKYAKYIEQMHHGEIDTDTSVSMAIDEINRQDEEKRSRKVNASYGIEGTTKIRTSYTYISPPLFPVEPELIESQPVAQNWRIESNVPFSDGTTMDIFHEFSGQTEVFPRAVYVISTHEDGSACTVADQKHELIEHELYLPLGLINAARQAVRATVPRRVSKKW